eukprot:UN5141
MARWLRRPRLSEPRLQELHVRAHACACGCCRCSWVGLELLQHAAVAGVRPAHRVQCFPMVWTASSGDCTAESRNLRTRIPSSIE